MKQFSMEIVGELVRFHRKRSGLSQLALADLAGIGKTAVFDIEKGKATIRVDSLLPVLRVLNISVELRSPLMREWTAVQEEGGGGEETSNVEVGSRKG